MSDLSLTQLEQSDLAAGWPSSLVPTDAAIQMAESSGNPNAVGPGGSWGTEQIQPQDWPQFEVTSDPVTQAQDALQIEQQQGLGAWSTYTGGEYQQFLPAAESAFANLQASGASALAANPTASSSSTPANPATTLGSGLSQMLSNAAADVHTFVNNELIALGAAAAVTIVLVAASSRSQQNGD